jgi:hypothetical protein
MTATGRSRFAELTWHSALELILTSLLLFGVVTIVRFVVGPSPISRAFPQIHLELLIVGAAVAVLLAGLIKSPMDESSDIAGHVAIWCVSCSRNTPLCRCTAARFSIRRSGRSFSVGKCRGAAAGFVRCPSTRSQMVSSAAVFCRGSRYGCHCLRGRILPVCPPACSIRAVASWDVNRARYCDSRHRDRWQPKSRTPVWARCGLWTHGHALGFLVGSDGGCRGSGPAAQDFSAPPPSTHAQTMWHSSERGAIGRPANSVRKDLERV